MSTRCPLCYTAFHAHSHAHAGMPSGLPSRRQRRVPGQSRSVVPVAYVRPAGRQCAATPGSTNGAAHSGAYGVHNDYLQAAGGLSLTSYAIDTERRTLIAVWGTGSGDFAATVA